MLGLKYLVTITLRENAEQYLDFFHRHNVNSVLSVYCNGTATDKTLSYFGLERTEKIMFKYVVSDSAVPDIVRGQLHEMNIGASGNGITVVVPLDGLGGTAALNHFTGSMSVNKEVCSMAAQGSDYKYALIITIVNRGNSDLVMDAAREKGARGGTIVKAMGTGAEIAKFFGVSIPDEKELVYIVTTKADRDGIMKSIMEKAGVNTDAHGIVFALPVESVIGLQSLVDID